LHGKERTTAQKVGSDRVSREIVLLTHICAKFSRLRRKGAKPTRFRAHSPGRRSNPAADLERRWALVYLSSRWSVGRTARCARVPFQPPSLPYPAPNKFNPLFYLPDFFLSADPLVRGSAADSARGRDRLHHRPRAAGRVPRRHRRVGQQREL